MSFDFDRAVDRGNTDSLKWEVREGVLPMWVADMDFPTAPAVTEALVKRAEHGVFGYTVVPDRWYDAIIGWWRRRHDLTIRREWLQFCTGVVPAITSIVKRVTNVGDNVVVLTPVYDIFFHSVENTGRHVCESKLVYDGRSYAIDFADLEKKLSHPQTTLFIFCNPHNPVGKIWTKEEIGRVGALCRAYGVTLLSDEIHCDLTRPNRSYIPFLAAEGNEENAIVCISASKAFNLAGLQSAAVVIPDPRLREKVVRGLNSDELAEPNCFAVEGTVAAFTQGEEWLDGLRAYIDENRRTVARYLKENVPAVQLVEGDATYLLWLDCGGFTDDAKEFCRYLRKTTGLFLSAGPQYRGNGETFVRMNVACSRARVEEGLRRLERGVKGYIASRS